MQAVHLRSWMLPNVPPALLQFAEQQSKATNRIQRAFVDPQNISGVLQAGFLASGSFYSPRLPGGASGDVRFSSPVTAMAGLRWNFTIFPFTGAVGNIRRRRT